MKGGFLFNGCRMLGVTLWKTFLANVKMSSLCVVVPLSLFVAMEHIVAGAPLPLVFHSGATNPPSEGWGGRLFGEGVFGEGEAKVDAWRIIDDSDDARSYHWVLTEEEAFKANKLGWILTVKVRVTDKDNPPNFTRQVDYEDPIHKARWGFNFGSTPEGDLIVSVRGTPFSHVFEDGDYHTCSLVFDPATSLAALYVDGETMPILEGYTGHPEVKYTIPSRIRWGSLGRNQVGEANYQEVSFSIPQK